MITEIIRDRIVKASLEISNARDSVHHILLTVSDRAEKPLSTAAGAPLNPHGMPLARAVDLLEGEIAGLQRELMEFRGDEPEEASQTIVAPGRYK